MPAISPIDFEFQTLSEGLESVAQRLGPQAALRFEQTPLTFAQLRHSATQIARKLDETLSEVGQRVAFIGRDCFAGYELLFGCAKAGQVFVPINWRLAGKELASILRDSKAAILFVDESSLEKLEQADADLLTHLGIVPLGSLADWQSAANQPIRNFVATPDTAVVQIYTSGTTGSAKGVVLAHRTFFRLLNEMRRAGDRWMDLESTDVLLLSLPIFHIGGLWWTVQGLMTGACGVLLDVFVGWKALAAIEEHRITQVAMVPAMIQFTLSEPNVTTTNLSSVRGFLYGGSPISPTLLQRAQETFTCPFFQIYGLTETGNTAVCLRPEDHADPSLWTAAGKPYRGVELRVVDREGTSLPSREIGEIWIKSPSAMVEYWKNPTATAEVLVDGWIRTGDAGYLDDKGYLHVCDRIKDMIIYAGENIYPAEVEAALLTHPAISEAAVIGVPDPQFGESVRAFLVVTSTYERPKTRELTQHCRQHLADFKIPKAFEFVSAIPRNPSGKILKHVLRQPYWTHQTRQVN